LVNKFSRVIEFPRESLKEESRDSFEKLMFILAFRYFEASYSVVIELPISEKTNSEHTKFVNIIKENTIKRNLPLIKIIVKSFL
jgi:hypothetical protein